MGPHAFGGIGGYHHRSGWYAWYETSPIYGYCPGYNIYSLDRLHRSTYDGSASWGSTGNVEGKQGTAAC